MRARGSIARAVLGLARRAAARVGVSIERTSELAELRARLAEFERGWAPGHFYSPIPSLEEVRARAATIFAVPDPAAGLPGLDLDDAGQAATFARLVPLMAAERLPERRTPPRRYYSDNPNFNVGEALITSGMLRHVSPRRVVEVGSGYSTALLVDVNEAALGGRVECVCVEPFPELARSLLLPGDEGRIVRIIASPVQDVPAVEFDALDAGDVLFIDSSHVAKCGSDVNHLYFNVLPRLRAGVYVHVHDVPYPFEYPREWIEQGRSWNEAYLLRALLTHSSGFDIVFFNSYFARVHAEAARAGAPAFAAHPGSSIWLRRR